MPLVSLPTDVYRLMATNAISGIKKQFSMSNSHVVEMLFHATIVLVERWYHADGGAMRNSFHKPWHVLDTEASGRREWIEATRAGQ